MKNDLSEKDIETAFANYIHHAHKDMQVIGRQVHLPMGILDLLIMGRDTHGYYAIVAEIKKDVVDERACSQILGYMGQVERIAHYVAGRFFTTAGSPLSHLIQAESVSGWLVGRRITPSAERAIDSLNIGFIPYSIGDHEIVDFHFKFRTTSLLFNHLLHYDIPKQLKVVGLAMLENAKTNRQKTAQFYDSGEVYDGITSGRDRHSDKDPMDSKVIWPHQK